MRLVDSHPELGHDATWKAPEMFDLGTNEGRKDLQLAFETGAVRDIIDPIDIIAQNLHEYDRPTEADNEEARDMYVAEIQEQGDEFGNWVLLPWSGQLVHYAGKEAHQRLRTARNRDLITPEEQATLLDKTVAVFGLSVGSNAADRMLHSGIGGKYIIGDMDALEVPNLNRLNATATQLGQPKVDILAKRISEVDPYVEQVHFRNGITKEEQARLAAEKPDIIIEEVDSMAVMAMLRVFARDHKLPLVTGTDIDLRSVIDVERYDLGATKLFGGRLSEKQVDTLLHSQAAVAEEKGDKSSPDDNTALMIKHLGLKNVSLRMMQSTIGRDDLGDSFPQLGTTAGTTGSLVAVAAREILLGRNLKSGRYIEDTRKTLDLPREHTVAQTARVLADLIKYMKG